MSSAITPPQGSDRTPSQDSDRTPQDRTPQLAYGNTQVGDRSSVARDDAGPDRQELVAHQKERFGGMKFGSAFFGWLAASGTAVLLSGLLAAIGAAVGANSNTTAADATKNAQTVGVVAGIVLLLVTLVAYFCGGYVAGRMARFDGLKQGVGVWLWALIAAVVVAVLSLVAGTKFNVMSTMNAFPSIPVSASTLSTGAIITAVLVAVIALVGAILGGLTGMRYHRKVDRVGLRH